jgi:hypothetical protein
VRWGDAFSLTPALAQRERAGVRENGHAVKTPLPSTGLFQ